MLGGEIAQIINVNPKSHYKSFPKISIKKAISELQKSSEFSPFDQCYDFSCTEKENIKIHDNLIEYLNIHLIHRSVEILSKNMN